MLTADPDIHRLMALRAAESGLLRLKWLAAATRFELALRRHDRALKYAYKAGFNPDQPRVPKDNPGGGQWTSEGGGSQQSSDSDQSKIPEERPPKSTDRTAVLKAIARRLLQTGETLAAIARVGAWFQTYSATIESYNDPPKSLGELQHAASTPAAGYDIHHIVEKSSAREDGFPREFIDSPDNMVRIPRMKHWEINAWYQRPNPEYDWEAPREYLRGRNWEVRTAVGLRALRIYGVLKP
jgi:hypothetical protein